MMREIFSALQSIWKSVILFNEIPGMFNIQELPGNDEGMYIHFLKCFLLKVFGQTKVNINGLLMIMHAC